MIKSAVKKAGMSRSSVPQGIMGEAQSPPLIPGIESVAFLARGKRGVVFTGMSRGRKVAIKIKKSASQAKGALQNEAAMLRILNRHRVGPALIDAYEDMIIYGFVDGSFIGEFVKSHPRKNIVSMLTKVLEQCFILDSLKLSKEEMHRPLKHIIISEKGIPVLIDFERCHRATKPKNVTQLCQFLAGGYVNSIMRQKGIAIDRGRLLAAAQGYKHSQNEENFKRILLTAFAE